MPNPSNAACRPGRGALAACLLVLAQVAGAADWNLDTAFNADGHAVVALPFVRSPLAPAAVR